MQSNRGRDTGPELAVRRELYAQGLRYRVDWRPLPDFRTRADIAFTRQHVLVFIDGCFWHGCPIHATTPKTNIDYWVPKLQRNIERDREFTRLLQDRGWQVLRFWEHEDPETIVRTIRNAVTPVTGPTA